jgi:hypothetical protein
MSNISNFISSINKYSDLARSDRFKVFIYPGPNKLTSVLGILGTEELSLRCEEAELPGRTIATADLRTYGPIIRYPTQTTYNDLSLTFLCTSNLKGTSSTGLKEKMIFEDWMDLVNPTPNSFGFRSDAFWNMNYKTDYAADIIIRHYDTVDNRPSYSVKIFDAFPIAINQVSLGWGTEGIIRLIVTFAYTRWTRISSSTITSSLIGTSGGEGPDITRSQNENFNAESVELLQLNQEQESRERQSRERQSSSGQ